MEKIIKWLSIILILMSSFAIVVLTCKTRCDRTELIESEKEREVAYINIKKKYNKYVKVVKNSDLYQIVNNNYIKIGIINKNAVIELENQEVAHHTNYFKLKGLNYYIDCNNVIPSRKGEANQRYKKYVVFNNNIVTKEITSFYNEDGSLYATLNKSFDLPIIVKEKDKYGVEILNKLLYVKKEEVKEIKSINNTQQKARSKIRTLTYHTVYQKGKEECNNTAVCHTTTQFEEQMKYIHDKGYFTLTMEELEMYLDGKIRIPKNSIVITLDDGRNLHNSVPIVEKYQVDATFFIITGINSIKEYTGKVKYAHFESHTDNLHVNHVCKGGYYGSKLLCTSYDDLVRDFKTCIKKLGGKSYYFAYPFFDSNDTIVKALKATGYKMAFVGEVNTGGYSDAKTDRYRLRRKTIFGDTSLKTLKSYLPESE